VHLTSDTPEASNPPQGRLFVLIVTYRRLTSLSRSLSSVSSQLPYGAQILVVDNDSDGRVARECAVFGATYIESPSNLGPAGGTTLGMKAFLEIAKPGDWLLRVDDDNPPNRPDLLPIVVGCAASLRRVDSTVGAVGLSGAVLHRRRWRLALVRPTAANILPSVKTIDADYLKTNWFPCWSFAMIHHVGGMRSELFFGLTEVEYGIRCRRHGYRLLVIKFEGQGVEDDKPGRRRILLPIPPDWRHYYRVRNNIVLAKEESGLALALRITVIRFIAKLGLSLLLKPFSMRPYLALTALAISDGYRSRLGKRIDPWDWSLDHTNLTDTELPDT
jgi:rhamnosyltransferase